MKETVKNQHIAYMYMLVVCLIFDSLLQLTQINTQSIEVMLQLDLNAATITCNGNDVRICILHN